MLTTMGSSAALYFFLGDDSFFYRTILEEWLESKQAAQFAPFAALVGYDDVVAETTRLTEKRPELDEQEQRVINERLAYINEHPEVLYCSWQVLWRSAGWKNDEYIKKSVSAENVSTSIWYIWIFYMEIERVLESHSGSKA